MSAETDEWERAYLAQTAMLRAQLNALRAGPKVRLNRFRSLEYVCKGCGDAFLEVFATSPYPVVVTRALEAHPGEAARTHPERPPGGFGSVEEASTYYRDHPQLRELRLRSGGRKFVPIAATDARVMKWTLTSACKCRQWDMSASTVLGDLKLGIKKRAFSGRVPDDHS